MFQMNINVFLLSKVKGVAKKLIILDRARESIWCLEVRQEPVSSTNPSAEKLH